MSILGKLIAFFIFFVILIYGFVYSGIYNVAAIKPDPKPLIWLLNNTKENSVRFHSKGIKVPNLDDESIIRTGFHHYDQMCVSCHGAPGISPSELGKGLNPEPPDLVDQAEHMSPAELFWITQNGIKMTGMPAFGPTHSDEELWGIVAFMQKLPDISPEQYRAMKKASESTPGKHDHSDHSH